MSAKPKIIIVCGPTGIGKTSTAIELARCLGGEIISADSMQIYRQMNIGTAKPTLDEQAMCPHHMIDIREPDEPFDAAAFSSMSKKIIDDLCDRRLVPIVAGGTGLYIKAMLFGLSRARPADPSVIHRLKKEASESGPELLHKRLKGCDPDAAGKIHPNDTFRIVRALEIYESTGKKITTFHDSHGFREPRYNALKIGLTMERKELYQRINKRVDDMIDSGLLQEVRGLLGKGYEFDLKPLQSIGYRQMCRHIRGEMSWDEAVIAAKKETRRYAKRQLTWFKADPEIKWFSPESLVSIKSLARDFVKGQPE